MANPLLSLFSPFPRDLTALVTSPRLHGLHNSRVEQAPSEDRRPGVQEGE